MIGIHYTLMKIIVQLRSVTGGELGYLRPLLVLCLALCLALCLLQAAPCSVPAHGRHHLQYIQITVFTKK